MYPVVPIVAGAGLLGVQREAYLVEAALIGTDGIPALRDTVESLTAAGLTWHGCRDPDGLLGAVATTATGGVVDIDRLVVVPSAFRRGVGTALVAHVLAMADGPVTVSTGRANTPARALYERAGFVATGEAEVEPGLWITHYLHE